MVKCRDAIERLGDVADGGLPLMHRIRLTVHLWRCKDCRDYLHSYRITLQAEQAALDDMQTDMPDSLAVRIALASEEVRSGITHAHGAPGNRTR